MTSLQLVPEPPEVNPTTDHAVIQEAMDAERERYERVIRSLEQRIEMLTEQNTALQAELFHMETVMQNAVNFTKGS
jgi:predicted RNase H-like nuclease (RuvC/YqgF family)